ncbi:MAG: succinate dehydrogenase [Candidatus Binataceae bacterium]
MAAGVPIEHSGFARTQRTDLWWVQWLLYFLGLGFFLIVYPTWALLQNAHYRFDNYLSPFYSPELYGSAKAWISAGKAPFWPQWLVWSPALLIMWAPAGFRLTCYYYRGAYYKGFFLNPMNCAVGEPLHGYRGENSWPLILQNAHRYFMYIALCFLPILSLDVYEAMWFTDRSGVEHFGIGIGTIVLAVNVVLLAGYTLGCHSLRSWVGGNRNWFSTMPIRAKCWSCVTRFNEHHMNWAWLSLFWVSFADFYIRMCAMGVFHDFRVLF